MSRTAHPHSARSTKEAAASGGWPALVAGFPWFDGEGSFPLAAYSEFMPPPRLGASPYGGPDPYFFDEHDPFGWNISEQEQEFELKPGMGEIARHLLAHLVKLGTGQEAVHLYGHKDLNLTGNPYWPAELAAHAGHLLAERYVTLLPLALSRTQDDFGRVRWTLFGGSQLEPELAFWKGFYRSPNEEIPFEDFAAFIENILSGAYAEKRVSHKDLARIGFRILPGGMPGTPTSHLKLTLPSWTTPFILTDDQPVDQVRYLLTFKPFASLPEKVQERYFEGSVALLPFPGSLIFWGMPTYRELGKKLPNAVQIPLLELFKPKGGATGIRIPQSGWFKEPSLVKGKKKHPDLKPSDIRPELLVETVQRTHRWTRMARYEDEQLINPRLVKVAKSLFSTELDMLGLYDKPMGKNAQLWTSDHKKLLDGPQDSKRTLDEANFTLARGGLFGYRYIYPAMQVGQHEVYFHPILAAFQSPVTNQAELIPGAPPGYLTAHSLKIAGKKDIVELWPRFQQRPAYLSAVQDFNSIHDHYPNQTALNLISLFEFARLWNRKKLPRSLARSILRIALHETLDEWLSKLPDHARETSLGQKMAGQVKRILEPASKVEVLPAALTFDQTATRLFEEAYWNDIFALSHGNYLNKDNADVVNDPATLSHLIHHNRDLDRLGDYLIERHRDAILKSGMQGKAECVEIAFKWHTEFDFNSFGGWEKNQAGRLHERDILVRVPGRDRSQAVVLADHYDTAYMEDQYEPSRGGTGIRMAAAGADDNHSATAALLQAAPIYLNMARDGLLEKDIWLLHLTGEEFPSDCMGARHFAQALVEKTLKIYLDRDEEIDLSQVRVVGVFVMDMIAHNRDHEQDVFQISPGKDSASLELAWQAHLANRIWNNATSEWNKQPERRGRGRGKRSQDGATIPEIAETLPLAGEIRTVHDPASSLFNTDGQIFSDVGIPVVLFMENYDINRTGYHDSKDTLVNIDLDYGSALAAIAIETAARVATL